MNGSRNGLNIYKSLHYLVSTQCKKFITAERKAPASKALQVLGEILVRAWKINIMYVFPPNNANFEIWLNLTYRPRMT